MPLTDEEVATTTRRARVMGNLLKKAEAASDFLELKATVLDLCRVVNAQVQAENFPEYD
ncbi:hypothetical protein [Mesorhizobium sp. M1142]|uniref:hypothetical protein n=1 Tax=Mesorhizobium sp. M1142 TaxID=2957060 RepID=UPI003334E173